MTLASLFNDPVVGALLSMDASARGNIVAACFSGMKPEEYWRLGGIAIFTVDFQMFSSIERHFFSSVEDRSESMNFDKRNVLYKIRHPSLDETVSVKVIYSKNSMNVYDVHLDLDMLSVNRLGMFICE